MNGMAQAPGGLEGGEPTRRGLVRREAVAGEAGASDSSIIPWLTLTGRSAASSSSDSAPALQWTRSPVSSQTSRGRRGEVLDRRAVAVVVEPGPARHRVAVLGALAEGEERLVAAGVTTGRPRWRATSSGREVRGGEACRLLGERAVAAAVATQAW